MTLKGITNDSIEPINTNENDLFLRKNKGKLMKGSTATGTVPTIPSKYFTIVSDNSDKKGFLNSSRRFIYDNTTDDPGPGSYCEQMKFIKKQKIHTEKRTTLSQFRAYHEFFKNNTPGAGSYNLENVGKKNDFSRGFSRTFQKPIVDIIEFKSKKEINHPGPNCYDISKSNKLKYKVNNVCADAAFKSKSKRVNSSVSHDNFKPEPGSYQINENLKYHSVKIPYSSFKSGSKRSLFSPSSLSDLPGPADYNPYDKNDENATKQLLPRKHYLAISAPAVPIHKQISTPGPGAYNLRNFEDPDKKYMSSAVFVSCTGRWTSEVSENDVPGPTSYTPNKPTKNSFHYNYGKKWV